MFSGDFCIELLVEIEYVFFGVRKKILNECLIVKKVCEHPS